MSPIRLGLEIVVCSVFVIAGCATTAGPFVTNISPDGQGGLVIEKAMVKFSQWSDGINTTNHTTSTIYIGFPDAQKSAEGVPAAPSEGD